MYTFKSIARRGTMLGAAVAIFAATIVPAAPAFADALNPLTERSLLLSSSAPGWQDTDGSGNATYAPAGSGPNGKKSGETFTFKVSSDAVVRGFSLQYCVKAAGVCQGPGNNSGDARTPTPNNRLANGGTGGGFENNTSDLEHVGAFTQGTGAGQFQVYLNGSDAAVGTWTYDASNLEDNAVDGPLSGKSNYIRLTNATGLDLDAGDQIRIVFRPSDDAYITNPGAGSFFVKINTYSTDDTDLMVGTHNDATPADDSDHTVIDGGVTVANVMTDSIHITTKVLETMSFSVGTQNPDTVNLTAPAKHGSCDAMVAANNNRLNMGDPNAEFSLDTGKAYDVHSYWRLSSNSSGGATVYYSGNTLANTVGDIIAPIGRTVGTPTGSTDKSHPGTEQFGLSIVPLDTVGVDADGTGDFDSARLTPSIDPLVEVVDYNQGSGEINHPTDWTQNATFSYDTDSLTTPVLIAQNSTDVIECATAKMRYIANIAANTPAGIYTTKVNYLAAPQY